MPNPELVGPSTPDEIATFLTTYVPSDDSKRHGRFFVVKQDGEVDLPAAEQSFRSRFNQLKSDAWVYEQEMTEQCEVIAKYAPVRGNKSMGTQSQKQLREMEHAKFKYHVRTLADKYNITSGAWIVFLNPDEVDDAWARTVQEIAGPNGRLAAAGATYAKVSSYSENFPFTISIFLEDMMDVVKVETAFRVAVEQCGFIPGSFKSDAMTILGISSKHPSKIAVSSYTKTSFMTTAESKAATEQYKLHGPATSISPLSGAPNEPEIDWDYTYDPFNDGQPMLDAGKSSPKKTGKGKGKGKGKKAAVDSTDSDDDNKAAIAQALAMTTPSRPSRKAAQKAAEILKQEADEANANRARAAQKRAEKAAALLAEEEEEGVKKEEEEGEVESPSKGRPRSRKDDDEAAWKPEPEELGGGKRFKAW